MVKPIKYKSTIEPVWHTKKVGGKDIIKGFVPSVYYHIECATCLKWFTTCLQQTRCKKLPKDWKWHKPKSQTTMSEQNIQPLGNGRKMKVKL